MHGYRDSPPLFVGEIDEFLQRYLRAGIDLPFTKPSLPRATAR